MNCERVFDYFEEICSIPHGSGNMEKISRWCVETAIKLNLRVVTDDSFNVYIYKDGTGELKNAQPLILQGHLDMVCQKEMDLDFDFLAESIETYIEGDFIKARGTSLGADNGIAVAIIMAILESDTIAHPPLEVVLTTDEEIGMLGAAKLNFNNLSAKRMINLDSEEMGVLTVSCAGGCDFKIEIPLGRKKAKGKRVDINISGLLGGHSGVDINKCRHNANVLMGRILNHLKSVSNFEIFSVSGGDKGNVIPSSCTAKLLIRDDEGFSREAEKVFETIRTELCEAEKGFTVTISADDEGEFDVFDSETAEKLLFLLTCAPNGVMEMSAKIENLVETSLNLGILKTEAEKVEALYTLRSNKSSVLSALSEKMSKLSTSMNCMCESTGFYPPWEYKENSQLQDICTRVYEEMFGSFPEIEAIHAGLECGIFSAKIKDLDCISIGPDMYDIHSVNERLSISSTKKLFEYLVEIMKNLE